MFEHVEPYAGDPIFALVDAFNADPRPHKVNLSIGIYFDDEGRIPVLDSVRAAEARLLAEAGQALSADGRCSRCAPRCAGAVVRAGSRGARRGRVATIQSVGSSGGLKVGADFLKRGFLQRRVDQRPELGQPPLDVRGQRLHGERLSVLRRACGGVRFDDMLAAIDPLPARSIVLLHACCHNPTGVDLTGRIGTT